VTATGGGYGGQRWSEAGGVGGSGGGASVLPWGTIASGAAGTSGQGHAGGGSLVSNGQQYAVGGGGGGAGTAGVSARLVGVVGATGTFGYAGNGGDGLSYSISGTAVTYAGGGAGSQMEAGYNGNGGAGYLNPGGGGSAGTPGAGGLPALPYTPVAGQAGIVMVSYIPAPPAEPFSNWMSNLSGVPAGQTGFGDDPNKDGVANGLAWLLLGGAPMVNSQSSLPVVTQSAGKVTLEFTCLKPGELGTATLELQYGNDLGTSQSAAVPGSNTTVNNVVFTVTAYDATHNHVKADIPQSAAAGGKLFGRLSASGN
ncbi:MAG: glycine-rich domain-containing protein, partial [Verrucomicrobiota bacterium]